MVVSFGSMELGRDRLVGCFQLSPTEFPGGDYADFYVHLDQERKLELRRTGNFRITKRGWPESAIEHCVIRTEYRPVYRIHSKAHFESGMRYPVNWASSERKRLRADRYSPYGTEGFYFGWTLKAAEDEARYYGRGTVDPQQSMILVLECCFDNILYLTAGCLDAVWEVLGLEPPTYLMDMYLAIMDPRTDNHTTNAIGLWARQEGFDGIVYPTARYGQEEWLQNKKHEEFTFVPAINFVDMGSHLCHESVAMRQAMSAANDAIGRAGGLDRCIPVWAEPNLVLFDGSQIKGDRWGVIYQTFPLQASEAVLSQDDFRRQARSYTYWSSDEKPSWLG